MRFYFDGSGERSQKNDLDELELADEELQARSPGKSSRTHGSSYHAEDRTRGRKSKKARGIPGKVSLTALLGQRPAEGAATQERSPATHEQPRTEEAGPLPMAIRARMERAFDQDFSDVRVHPDSLRAGGSTHAVTEGRDIHFAPGRYAPGTAQGDWLIGHELAHVIQQSGAQGTLPGNRVARQRANRPALEGEADRAATVALAGGRPAVQLTAHPGMALAFSESEPREAGIPDPASAAALLGQPDPALYDRGSRAGQQQSPDAGPDRRDRNPAGQGTGDQESQDARDQQHQDAGQPERNQTGEPDQEARDQRATGPAQASQAGTQAPGQGMRSGGGAGDAAQASAAVIDTGSPDAILASLAQTPVSQLVPTYTLAQAASPAVLQAQRDQAQQQLPKIPTPTGLPPRRSAAGDSESATPELRASRQPARENLAPEQSGKQDEAVAMPVVAEAPPASAPKPTQLAGSDAGVEQDASGERKPTSDPALARSAQNALAGVTMPAGQVPTTATDVPRMDMSGEADPGQLQSALDTSGQQTREATIEAAQATHNDFGENAIYPEADGEILEATQGLGEASLAGLAPSAETAPAALPAEALASIDAEVSPILHEKIGAEQQTYVQGKAGHDAEAQAAHEQARQDITSLEDSTTASQTEAQTLARSDVSAARQEWQTGIDQIQTDFQTQAGAARSEHVAQIQTRQQAGNQEAAGHLAEAENKAELEKQKAERKAEEKQNAAKQESKGFWGWAKSKAKALVDGLKQAVNFIYDNLRKAVKALFEAAKKLALAAIELARRAIVGLIQVYGAILKGLVSVALAAFPELRDRVLARIDQAVTRATEIVNQAADALKQGVTAILDVLASTIDSILGLIQDLYNAALTVIGMLVSGELAELMKRLGDLVAAARTAPGQFETAAYEELLGGNLDQPLSPAELMAAGRTPPGGAGPGAVGEMGSAADGQLPGPPWSEANVGVEAMASGVELDTELGDEILQMTGGGDGEVVFGESQDPSRNMDAILGLQGQDQTHGRAPGQQAAYTDGLTPRERAAVKWDMMKKGLAEWWSKSWPYVLAGGVLAVAGFIVANILTGGAILAALPAIMSAVGYIFAGVTAVQLAGHLRDFLQKGWNGDIQGGGKSLAKGLAAGAVELLTWLTFKVGSVAMRGAKASARGVARGAQAAARGAAKVARRGATYVLQGGKVMLRGVSQGIARGVKRLRDLGARLLQRTRFKGFRIRVHGRRFTLEGKINPWVVLLEGEMRGRLAEVGDEMIHGLKIGDEGALEIAGQPLRGRLVSGAGSDARIILQAGNIDGIVRHVLENVKGLSYEQARFILERVRDKGGTIVFGGSRVRGAPQFDDLGRVVSDMDVGFEGLTQNQIIKIVNSFNKVFTGSSQGSNRIIEHTWIYSGSQPRSIPEILSPEEFFTRFGIRADGRNIGKSFGPSGHVKVSSDGTIEIFKP